MPDATRRQEGGTRVLRPQPPEALQNRVQRAAAQRTEPGQRQRWRRQRQRERRKLTVILA